MTDTLILREMASMEKSTGPTVLSAGYVSLDIVSYRGRIWHSAGGTAANVAAILGYLGWQAAVVADLGNDLAGHEIREDLKKAKVSVRHVRLVDGAATPRLVHQIDANGHRYRFKCPTCHSRFPMSRPLRKRRVEELLELDLAPDVFFFDRLNAGTIALAERFASKECLVIYHPSRPARPEWTARALRAASVVKWANDRDPGLGTANPIDGQVWIRTSGRKGAEFKVGNGDWNTSDGFASKLVDAGGAGDWTTAGVARELHAAHQLTNENVCNALVQAQALAALSCSVPGARGLASHHAPDTVLRYAQTIAANGTDLNELELIWNGRNRRVPRTICNVCFHEAKVQTLAPTGT